MANRRFKVNDRKLSGKKLFVSGLIIVLFLVIAGSVLAFSVLKNGRDVPNGEVVDDVVDEVLVGSIDLGKDEVVLEVGGSYQIEYVVLPDDANDKGLSFVSDDVSVAVVDDGGKVSVNKVGGCSILVSSIDGSGVSSRLSVVVKAKPVVVDSSGGLTYIDGILVVNKSYSLPSSYNPGVDKAAMAAFESMRASARKDGLSLFIVSGFRSYSYQASLYSRYVSRSGQAEADRFSARPGHSEHQSGLALDINSADSSFAGTKEAIWLENNSYRFGFIVRYPKGKEGITGYMYEPWHMRYIGVDKATKVYNSGLCLEEYLGIDSVYK